MSDETKNNEDEPSIEEILSSIRDIISDEDEDGKGDSTPPPAKAAEAPEEKPSEDVEDAPVVEVAPEPEPEPVEVLVESESSDDGDDDDVLELTDLADAVEPADESIEVEDDSDPLAGIDLNHPEEDDLDVSDDDSGIDDILGVENDADDEADVFETASVESPSEREEGLVDRVAESATVGAMAKLAENIAISKTASGVTLEDIVRESLRPMLKDWLDENLPALIERLVSQELERLSNKAAGK